LTIVPTQFKKFQCTDFIVQVNNTYITEELFSTLVENEVEISIVSLSLPFSEYNEIEQLEDYAKIAGLDCDLELPAKFVIPPDSLIPSDVFHEISARLEVFDLTETIECIMREFIGPILIGSIRLLGPLCGVKIRSDHKIEGRRGRGPVDYDILFHLFHIVVCEAKNGRDVVDAIPQNGAQLVASREVFQNSVCKKRKRDENEISGQLDKLKSFGIVSTGRSWVFICYYKDFDDGNWKLAKSVETHLPLWTRIYERGGLEKGITELLAIVAGIILSQKNAVEEFEKLIQDEEAAKRLKTTNSSNDG
jgi:hypothetical protein